VFAPSSQEEEGNLMNDLGLSLNLNLAACWLKLDAFGTAKNQRDFALKLDLFNVKARFRRA